MSAHRTARAECLIEQTADSELKFTDKFPAVSRQSCRQHRCFITHMLIGHLIRWAS